MLLQDHVRQEIPYSTNKLTMISFLMIGKYELSLMLQYSYHLITSLEMFLQIINKYQMEETKLIPRPFVLF